MRAIIDTTQTPSNNKSKSWHQTLRGAAMGDNVGLGAKASPFDRYYTRRDQARSSTDCLDHMTVWHPLDPETGYGTIRA